MDLNTLSAFLLAHGYVVMFLLMMVEGPVVGYVGGFAAALGFFDVWVIALLSFLGNVLGDAVNFYVGYISYSRGFADRYVHKVMKVSLIKRIKWYLKNHTGKALCVIKLTPSFPIPGILLAGHTITFRRFLLYSTPISLCYSGALVAFGYFSGVSFSTIPKYVQYGDFLVGAVVIVVIVAWHLLSPTIKKMAKF